MFASIFGGVVEFDFVAAELREFLLEGLKGWEFIFFGDTFGHGDE